MRWHKPSLSLSDDNPSVSKINVCSDPVRLRFLNWWRIIFWPYYTRSSHLFVERPFLLRYRSIPEKGDAFKYAKINCREIVTLILTPSVRLFQIAWFFSILYPFCFIISGNLWMWNSMSVCAWDIPTEPLKKWMHWYLDPNMFCKH